MWKNAKIFHIEIESVSTNEIFAQKVHKWPTWEIGEVLALPCKFHMMKNCKSKTRKIATSIFQKSCNFSIFSSNFTNFQKSKIDDCEIVGTIIAVIISTFLKLCWQKIMQKRKPLINAFRLENKNYKIKCKKWQKITQNLPKFRHFWHFFDFLQHRFFGLFFDPGSGHRPNRDHFDGVFLDPDFSPQKRKKVA